MDSIPQQKRPERNSRQCRGRAQLSLVEHALCPLDKAVSLNPGFRFDTSYFYFDSHSNKRSATVSIGAVHGISSHDELYLWGLLALALSQPEPSPDFYATPYYCLTRLGLSSKPGGRAFDLFRNAVRRLGGVRYENSAFYDPVRGEYREVSFGFLNYSLPLDAGSSRAWRFAWDPIFFELAQATGGALSFDLTLFRELDVATRRLYLWLKKVLWRRDLSPRIDLRHLATDVLGFSADLETWQLKRKVTRSIDELLRLEVITLPDDCRRDLFHKVAAGVYTLQLARGPAFLRRPQTDQIEMEDSPVCDALQSIGFNDREIRSLLSRYKVRVLERWADITLAARERNGDAFFTTSPQAYFIDNVKAVSTGHRTEPDWWRDMRRREQQQEREQEQAKQQAIQQQQEDGSFEEYIRDEAREAFAQVTSRLLRDYTAAGQSHTEARSNAEYAARLHFRSRFHQQRGGRNNDGMTSIADLIPR